MSAKKDQGGSANTPSLPATVDHRNHTSRREPLPSVGDTHPVNAALESLLTALDGIRRTYYQVLPKSLEWIKEEFKRNDQRLAKFERFVSEDGRQYRVSNAHDTAELLGVLRDMKNLRGPHMLQTLERSLFTQIFSEFDAFIGALLTAIYTSKAELLKGISREITLSELLEFESLDAVKLNMLEKEIENFRRDSYVEQFSTLEKKFNFKTLRDFPEWGEFVELSQRRNILTHNGGRVSEQYLLVCEREKFQFDTKPRLGDLLRADSKYFSRAIILVSKVGFMLAHTLWRKVFPHQSERQAQEMNDAIYGILEQERWKTAAELATFSLTEQMRKDVPEALLRVRIVNCAIALKFGGRGPEAVKLLDSFDWTASYRDFKLAVAVLKEDFDEAARLMKGIGRSGEMVDQVAYHQWPLFHKFRGSEIFQQTYQEIYGDSFVRKAVEDAGTASHARAEDVSPKLTTDADKAADDAQLVPESKRRQRRKADSAEPIRERRTKTEANTEGTPDFHRRGSSLETPLGC